VTSVVLKRRADSLDFGMFSFSVTRTHFHLSHLTQTQALNSEDVPAKAGRVSRKSEEADVQPSMVIGTAMKIRTAEYIFSVKW